MEEREILEIEADFQEAWEEYFGQTMYYVNFIESPTPTSIYRESKVKVYDEANKILFHGTYKENPTQEELAMGGLSETDIGLITFVTKELYEQGILTIDDKDVIDVIMRDGTTRRFNIISHQGKVQFGSHKVFTKIGVREYGK